MAIKPKVKYLKYEIPGKESNRPAMELASAIVIGLLIPVLIAVIVRFADAIDSIDNFYAAYAVGMLAVGLGLLILCKK